MSRPDSLATHLDRWHRALQGRMRTTREMWIDKLVVSNKAWSPDDLSVFWGQNREPSNYPILHTVRESVCGLEAQTRRDTVTLARTRIHQPTAEALTGLSKYVDQANRADYVRSRAFRNAVDLGVGWTEVFYSDDPMAETIGKRSVDPFHIWCDPTGREDDLSDYQDMFRARWVPRSWLEMRFERARNGGGQFSPVFNYDPLSHTQNYYQDHGDEPPISLFNQGMGGDPNYGPGHGYRAPLVGYGWATQDADNWWRVDRYGDLHLVVERWYRADEWANFLFMRDGRVIECTPDNTEMVIALAFNGKGNKIERRIARKMRCALFVADGNGGLLQDVPSPYPHGQFPFIPTWAYKDEEGQPLGLVRLLRDPAREFNMRRTYLTKISMMRQVHVEDGTFLDEDDAIRELGKPNGVVRYQQGRLAGATIESMASMDAGMANLQANLLTGALQMVQNLGPVSQEMLGQETDAKSGVAIEQRQQQAHITLSHLFDMRNLAQQIEGEQTIAMIQDSYTEEKEVRINGTTKGLEWLEINKHDPTTGTVLLDVSQGRYDVIVDEQPEAPTVRAAKLQAIAPLMQSQDLPPAIRLQVAVALAEAQDLPGEIVALIQKAQTMAENPQPQQQGPRKSLDEIIKIALPDLTPMERAQVLQAVGVQPDPSGPPQQQPQGEPARPLDPNLQMAEQAKVHVAHVNAQTKLATEQGKNQVALAKIAHDAHQNDADRAHEAGLAMVDQQHLAGLAAMDQQAQAGEAERQRQHDQTLALQQHQQALEQAAHQASLTPEPSPQAGVSD